MSFSNPSAKNPAVRFFQWRGGAEGEAGKETGGKVTYYDKEKEENVEVPLPFSFIVLDELHTIAGFSKADKSSFWSNEIRNLAEEKLTVKTKSGVKAQGLYGDLAEVKSKGAKYAKSVYIAFKDDTGELAIGNIKIMGAALTAWIEFQKRFDVTKCAVLLEGAKKAKNGSNIYFVPVFDGRNISSETRDAVIALDKELQSYLESYLSRRPDVSDEVETEVAKEEKVEIEDLDKAETVDADKHEPNPGAATTDSPTEKADDDTIDLKDVPF